MNQLLLDAAARNEQVYLWRKERLENGDDPRSVIDVADFPHIVNFHWREVFQGSTGGERQVGHRMHVIAVGRNQVAHPDAQDVDIFSTIEHLSSIRAVLFAIRAQDEANKINEIINAYPIQVESSGENGNIAEPTKATVPDVSREPPTKSKNGVRPWREVIAPHPDVISSDLTNDTFAADLKVVAEAATGYDEYTDPVEFFNRSYLTPGLKDLMVNTMKRTNGLGGSPVIQMKSGFGGGKTHSLIALFHLVKSGVRLANDDARLVPQARGALQEVFDTVGILQSETASAKVAVISGTDRSVSEWTRSEDGTRLNTLWGYMAYELGGQDALDIVREAEEEWSTAAGQQLDLLFDLVGPCVVLIDELVAYARTLNADQTAKFQTFLQALTESAARNKHVGVVVTVPEREHELGGPRGIEAQKMIESVLGRMETISAPLDTQEAFEVVRRRLFDDTGELSESIEATADAFYRMYARRSNKRYPEPTAERDYRNRIVSCYPIHPEVFDRLFEDWSAIPTFQSTRGVLRLMAIAINRLYATSSDPLIMPGNLPLDYEPLHHEFTKILTANWQPAIEEIDGPNSRADSVDQKYGKFQRHGDGAAKRVARTIFLGSVPEGLAGRNATGIDEYHIRLGTAQPDEKVPTYDDALKRLLTELYYLHNDKDRGLFFVHSNPNLLKVKEFEADNVTSEDIDNKVQLMVEEMAGSRFDEDVAPIVFPTDSSEIPDNQQLKIAILPPDVYVRSRERETNRAHEFALDAVAHFGARDRVHRNTVLFLAGKSDNIQDLRSEARDFKAWDSVVKNAARHNLSRHQRNDAAASKVESQRRLDIKILQTFREVLAPIQRDPSQSAYQLREITVSNPEGNIIASAIAELKTWDEIVFEMGYSQFNEVILIPFFFKDKNVDHIEVGTIWDTLTAQVYMPRLANRGVLNHAVRMAVEKLDYVEASEFNDPIYIDPGPFLADKGRLLVRGSAYRASKQLEAEQPKSPTDSPVVTDGVPSQGVRPERPSKPEENDTETGPEPVTLLTVTKELAGQSAVDGDYNQIRDDLVKALRAIGGEVTVRITVEASNSSGFDQGRFTTVKESAHQLGMIFGSSS